MAKRKKKVSRRPTPRGSSAFKRRVKTRTLHAKPTVRKSNSRPKKHHRKSTKSNRRVKEQRRSTHTRKSNKRAVKRPTLRKKSSGKGTRQERELDRLRDRLRRTEEALRTLSQQRTVPFIPSGRARDEPDTPVRPREYQPSRTRKTEFDEGEEFPVYSGERWDDIDWDDFDWDYFDEYADEDEDSYGDEAK